MNERGSAFRSLLSGLIAGGLFLLLFLGLHWALLVSIPMAIASWWAVFLLLSPQRRIGQIPVDGLEEGWRLDSIYQAGQNYVHRLMDLPSQVEDAGIAQQASTLASIGQDIMTYLSNHPDLLSKSEHFIRYYMDTALRILTNYLQVQEGHVSKDQWQKVQGSVSESLRYLCQIFTRQRDSFHQDLILDLEVESDLLEKTVKLSGGRQHEA